MSVSYENAIATLHAMFAEVDTDVIKMVLDNNGGHMERTVENLLAMTGGAPAADVQQQPQQEQQPQPAQHQQQAATQPVLYGAPGAIRLAQADVRHQRVPQDHPSQRLRQHQQPMPQQQQQQHHSVLADDFLRPPSWWAKHNSGASSSFSSSQVEQDEQIARMLADELFLEELRQHPEWLMDDPSQRRRQRNRAQNQNANSNSRSDSPSPSFRDKMSKLSDKAKLKFKLLAAKFSRDKKKQGGVQSNAQYSQLNLDDDSQGLLQSRENNQFSIDDDDSFLNQDNHEAVDRAARQQPQKRRQHTDTTIELQDL